MSAKKGNSLIYGIFGALLLVFSFMLTHISAMTLLYSSALNAIYPSSLVASIQSFSILPLFAGIALLIFSLYLVNKNETIISRLLVGIAGLFVIVASSVVLLTALVASLPIASIIIVIFVFFIFLFLGLVFLEYSSKMKLTKRIHPFLAKTSYILRRFGA